MQDKIQEKNKPDLISPAYNNILQGAKYLWILPPDERELVNQIASDCNLSLPVAQISSIAILARSCAAFWIHSSADRAAQCIARSSVSVYSIVYVVIFYFLYPKRYPLN